jgi:sulfatase modifying factor 1
VLVLDLGDGVKMEFVRIPTGTFQMGSPPGEKERRVDEVQHTVELTHDFYLGKYEVTRGQFRAFVNETGYRTEPETDANCFPGGRALSRLAGTKLLPSAVSC